MSSIKTPAKVQHITSGVISHNGLPHMHAICVVVGKKSTHPLTILAGPYSNLDVQKYMDDYAATVDLYDTVNPAFEARIGEMLTPCHVSVQITDLRIQLHDLAAMNVVLAATGTMEGVPIHVIERWGAATFDALPSPQAAIDMVSQKLMTQCLGTHNFAAMLTTARSAVAV